MISENNERFRQQLQEIIARIQPDAAAVTEQVRESGAGELSNVPMHLGDRGTEEYLRNINATLLENERSVIEEAFAALRRISEGTYGRCERCGQPIIKQRLEAIPYTRYCTPCAAATEGPLLNINDGRAMSPDETLAGQAGMEDERLPDEKPSYVELQVDDQDHDQTDIHAVGTPGGGTALGGLGGTNAGHGEPVVDELNDEAGSGVADVEEAESAGPREPKSGRAGGAVGGTPAGKRASDKH